jgi:hypothetical protein
MTDIANVTRFVAARYCSDDVQAELLNARDWADLATDTRGAQAVADNRMAHDLLTAAAAPLFRATDGQLSTAVRNAVAYIEDLQRQLIVARSDRAAIVFTTDSPKAAAAHV